MPTKIVRYFIGFSLFACGVNYANDKFWFKCISSCTSCKGVAGCVPGQTTYKSEAIYDTAEEANAAGAGEQCAVGEIVATGPAGSAAGDTSPGITPLNYKRQGLLFGGVSPDYAKYETVNETVGGVTTSIKKPVQLPTRHSTIFYSDLADGSGFQGAQYLNSRLSSPDANGFRTIPPGVEPVTITIYRNPDGSASTTNGRMEIIHKQRHPQSGAWVVRTIRKSSPQGNNDWKTEFFLGEPSLDSSISSYREMVMTRTPHENGTETVHEVTRDRDGAGNLVVTSDATRTYAFYKYGSPVVIEETIHSGTGSSNDISSSWTYYYNAADQVSFNKPATLRRTDGQWANYTYTGSPVTGVLVAKTVSGWLDQVAPSIGTAPDENESRVVTQIEAKGETGTFGREEKILGVLVSKTWGERYKDNAGQVIEKSRVETGTVTLTTIRTGYPTTEAASEAERGRLKSIENPDGTVELHRYQLQGDNRVETTETGAGTLSGVTAGTRTISTYSAEGTVIRSVVVDIASGVELSAKEAISFDAHNKPTRWAFNHNPDDYSETLEGCCGIDATRSRDGIVTTYTRDALKRPLTEVSLGITTTHGYGTKTIGGVTYPTVSTMKSGGGITLDLGIQVYDHAGNVIERISPDLDGDTNPEITTIATNANTRLTTITNPDGGTQVMENYRDGQSKSLTGTAVAPTAWLYGTHALLGGGEVTTVYAGTLGSSRWTKTYSNLGGSLFKTTLPDGGGEIAVSTQTFDGVGRLSAKTDADGVSTLFAYDAQGMVYRTAIDLNQNGSIDGADRVADNLQDVVTGGVIGAAVRTRSILYDLSNNPMTGSTNLEAVNGLVARTETLAGGASQSTLATWQDHLDGEWTDVRVAPDGTKTTTLYQNWLPTVQAHLDTSDHVIESVTTGYDALRRPTAKTDSRKTTLTTRTTYTVSGLVSSITEDLTSGTDRVTGFAYDASGRRVAITLPDGSVTHTSYWPTGHEKASWGSQTYPTVKLYSAQGESIELRTWRSSPPATPDETSTGFDKTTWAYNYRGQMTDKRDAANKGPTYTFTPGGRLLTRTSARGIVTTYGYNSAGEPITIDYDDTTPDVVTVYDKLGRQSSVSNGVAQSVFAYDAATLNLTSETVSYDVDGTPGFEFSRTINRSKDGLGRDTGWQLKNGTTVENQAVYGYAADHGRLATVSGLGSAFAYSYTSGASLIASITGPVHTVTNVWAEDRDVLKIKENKAGSSIVSSFSYDLNALARRSAVVQTGAAFPAVRNISWGYDTAGQLISAESSNSPDSRAFEYDAIGNRRKSANGLVLPGGENYTSNQLNQYIVIDGISPVYDDDGNALEIQVPSDPSNNSIVGWDAENRLRTISIAGAESKYFYDSQGRRISKITSGGSRLFIYDGFNCIAEYVGAALNKANLWGPDISGSMCGAGGVGGLLAITRGGEDYYASYDGNGNVSDYVDSSGDLAAHFEYDSFGRTIADTDSARFFDFRFSTKQEDIESGLCYFGYRYYNPLVGRWIARDPIDEEGGNNLYGMVANDPVNLIDVLGCDFIAEVSNTIKGLEKFGQAGHFALGYFKTCDTAGVGKELHYDTYRESLDKIAGLMKDPGWTLNYASSVELWLNDGTNWGKGGHWKARYKRWTWPNGSPKWGELTFPELLGISEIVYDKKITDNATFIIPVMEGPVDDPAVKAKWDEIVALAKVYAYAEQEGFEVGKAFRNWPNSRYFPPFLTKVLGSDNNSNVFARFALKTTGLPIIEPKARDHPPVGDSTPDPIPAADYLGLPYK